MCGIAGFFNPTQNYQQNKAYYTSILQNMCSSLKHRGPDDNGQYLTEHCGFAHTRLSIIDLYSGSQPMLKTINSKTWAIIYNGELYNTQEIKADLLTLGYTFQSTSDTEVILTAFIAYGADFVSQLNGIFAFAIYNPLNQSIYLYRDHNGVKPLYYTYQNQELVFSSEIKGIFAHPKITPTLDKQGLNEIFSLGPAHTYGCGVFKDIHEVLPGHYLCINQTLQDNCYFKLQSHPHEDDYNTTVETTKELIYDAISRQMVADVDICTFLSGGVDSSIVASICANELKKHNKQLNTFSFDFVDNDINFKPSSFQPSQDKPYVTKMVDFLQSNHHYLQCSIQNQSNALIDSLLAHDLPSMADVDSSMLYFCSQVKTYNKVALTGECADEIFGGYPWFHKQECFNAQTFPWTMDLAPRKALLKDEFINYLDMDEYVSATYQKSLSEVPTLAQDTPTEARRREITYLNLKWFMQTLLNRMDRTSMYSGLEARVPYADYRIVQYLWNIPWEMKTKDGVVKGLLRESAKGLLPQEILYRKKSPYPKIYDTKYETLLKEKFNQIITQPTSPILQFIDLDKLHNFLNSPSDYSKPWYGQLMAGPQMLAYLYQINYWLENYHIQILT